MATKRPAIVPPAIVKDDARLPLGNPLLVSISATEPATLATDEIVRTAEIAATVETTDGLDPAGNAGGSRKVAATVPVRTVNAAVRGTPRTHTSCGTRRNRCEQSIWTLFSSDTKPQRRTSTRQAAAPHAVPSRH